ncbi:MAG: hypothetical protein ACYTFY_14900 [Planctomycetota bacterium]|jgi:hypothetical protein
MSADKSQLNIGWASADISTEEPVLIAGQFHSRVSEGVKDPLTVTALALSNAETSVIMVSCDLVSISDSFKEELIAKVKETSAEVPVNNIVLNATHTHTGPETRKPGVGTGHTSVGVGVDLDYFPIEKYVEFAAEKTAAAVVEAWQSQKPGGMAFGQGYAAIGRNRRWVNEDGVSKMYGNTDDPAFSHIEGCEDHALGLLAFYNSDKKLTGLLVNVPCPSQSEEALFVLSADYWHEVRCELHSRFGKDIFILPQCSAAGDQSPRPIYDKAAIFRMRELKGITERQEIAAKIIREVSEMLPLLETVIEWDPVFKFEKLDLSIPLNSLTEEHVKTAEEDAAEDEKNYQAELEKLEADPDLRKEPRWYKAVSRHYRHMMWNRGVATRFEQQKENPEKSVELNILRIGDAAVATNPFEYYLDFGIKIKARSPAVQTFLVQLSGAGTYVPSKRSTEGGGYGSVPSSTPVGPEGGKIIADKTIETLLKMWDRVE